MAFSWHFLGINLVMLFGIWVTQHSLGIVALAIPCFLVITAMNVKLFKFCDRCGKSVQGWWCKEPKVWSGLAVNGTSRVK